MLQPLQEPTISKPIVVLESSALTQWKLNPAVGLLLLLLVRLAGLPSGVVMIPFMLGFSAGGTLNAFSFCTANVFSCHVQGYNWSFSLLRLCCCDETLVSSHAPLDGSFGSERGLRK